jgi:competence protein ComEA
MQLTKHKTVTHFYLTAKWLLIMLIFSVISGRSIAVENLSEGKPQVMQAQSKVNEPLVAGDKTKVNINQADAEELASVIKGVGLKKAEAIVRYREQNGPFTQIDQLQEVPGIGPTLLERNRDRLKI